ncbi:MAG TPA: SgcJ/EcaC family oxidoreductase [Sphingomicrobium sp.]|nr:SgcJ/EcaC family oxidoreductase [Sphingomicrobium sp.]
MEVIRKSAMIAGAGAFALSLAACEKYQNASGAGADPGAIKNAIKADEKKWQQQVKAKDTEGLAGHYADDAYFVPGDAPPADGSTAIRQFYANASTDPALDVELTNEKIDVAGSGDMAYSRGHYTEKYTDRKTGKVMSDKGSYLAVYKKQPDRSWKIVEDFASTDPSSAKPVEPGKPATRAKMTSF